MKIFIVCLSFFLISCHKCVHDDLDDSSFQLLAATENGDDGEKIISSVSFDRMLQEYEPMRILADYSSKIPVLSVNLLNARFGKYHSGEARLYRRDFDSIMCILSRKHSESYSSGWTSYVIWGSLR